MTTDDWRKCFCRLITTEICMMFNSEINRCSACKKKFTNPETGEVDYNKILLTIAELKI
jgi:hypothetical protein